MTTQPHSTPLAPEEELERLARENEAHRQEMFQADDEGGVDEASDESFPASDPPSHHLTAPTRSR
ncbi:MAG: hypothetical protein AB2A00_21700 [Myxococcota bacterium]